MEGQLRALRVGGLDGVQVLEYAVQEVVDVRLRHVVAGDDHGPHGHGGDVAVRVVDVLLDDVPAVVGGGLQERLDVLVVSMAEDGSATGLDADRLARMREAYDAGALTKGDIQDAMEQAADAADGGDARLSSKRPHRRPRASGQADRRRALRRF